MRKKRRNAKTLQLNSRIQVQQRVIMNVRVACVSCCEAQPASMPRTLRLRSGQAPSTSLRAGSFDFAQGGILRKPRRVVQSQLGDVLEQHRKRWTRPPYPSAGSRVENRCRPCGTQCTHYFFPRTYVRGFPVTPLRGWIAGQSLGAEPRS